jgi:hypothetical protein
MSRPKKNNKLAADPGAELLFLKSTDSAAMWPGSAAHFQFEQESRFSARLSTSDSQLAKTTNTWTRQLLLCEICLLDLDFLASGGGLNDLHDRSPNVCAFDFTKGLQEAKAFSVLK